MHERKECIVEMSNVIQGQQGSVGASGPLGSQGLPVSLLVLLILWMFVFSILHHTGIAWHTWPSRRTWRSSRL